MRNFLDAILEFIGSESLTDEEFDVIDALELPLAYEKPQYRALRATLEARESVSDELKKLKLYFIARGADLSGGSSPGTAIKPHSAVFIGGGL